MRPYTGNRGASPIAIVTMVVVTLIVGTGLTLVTLWVMGVPLPFLTKAEPPPRPDGVPIPLSGRAIPAYTKLNRDHFRNPKTNEHIVTYRPAEEIERVGIIVDESKLVNRVLAHDIPAGYAIREKDLLPKGTHAGETGGVPEGMRLFVLQADKIQGIHGLKQGDRFDLLASVPVDTKSQAKLLTPGSAEAILAKTNGKQADVRAIVQNGLIVVPLTIREIPTGVPSAAKGGKVPGKPVEEVKIAIDPKEVAPLHEALAIQASLVCVARSGRPEESKAKTATPGSAPPPAIHAMEIMQGKKRQTLVFPTPGKGPTESPMLDDDDGPTKK